MTICIEAIPQISDPAMEVLCRLPLWPETAKIADLREDVGIVDVEPLLAIVAQHVGVRRGRGKSAGIPRAGWARATELGTAYLARTQKSDG